MKVEKRIISSLCAAALMIGSFAPASMAESAAKWAEEKTKDGWIKITQEGGKTLGYSPDSGVTILTVDGYAFKDLDRDGELDAYEDWRLTDEERAASLAKQLTNEECFGLMMYSDIFTMENDGSKAYDNGQAHSIYEKMDEGVFSFLSFATSYPAITIAKMSNNGQKYAESLQYGIPMNIATNPQTFGAPGNLAIGATFDTELALEVSKAQAKQYRATGVTTELGPSIELASEPRWSRVSGTYGEDPALSKDIANAIISGLQSTYDDEGNDLGWGEDSIIAMMKHFPGDGQGEAGRESHSDAGAYNVYPGDQFETSLIPFVDGALQLDSLTGESAATMLSMSIAYSDDESYGELVGSACSEYKISILRDQYGYDGLICTDWLFSAQSFGTEDWTPAERRLKMVLAGVDMIGGDTDPSAYMTEVWPMLVEELGEEAALTRLQESARRILKTFFKAGKFENPYLETAKTSEIMNNEATEALYKEASLKSIVMLKNDGVIKQAEEAETKPTVYIPMMYTPTELGYMYATYASWNLPVDLKTAERYFNVVTDTVLEPTGEADDQGNPTYTANDIQRVSAEELEKCDFALVIAHSPRTSSGYDDEKQEYIPITLQYREYTANSEGVRSESISGKMLVSNLQTPYGVTTNLTKENRSYYGKTATSNYEHDLDAILYAAENMGDKPVVVAVNTTGAFCVNEFENKVDSILVGFDIDDTLFLEIAAGNYEPQGLLPVVMPKDMAAVEVQLEDVPRDTEPYTDADGNTYDFAYGLNWSGVINDERVAKYNVPALTEPETQPVK